MEAMVKVSASFAR